MEKEHAINSASIGEIIDEVREWAEDELLNCWTYEDDSFSYTYGSIIGIYNDGHFEFNPPKPLVIHLRGSFPFFSYCLDAEVYASTIIEEIQLEDILFDGVKVVGKLQGNDLIISLEEK